MTELSLISMKEEKQAPRNSIDPFNCFSDIMILFHFYTYI